MKSFNHFASCVAVVIVAILLQPTKSHAAGEAQSFNFPLQFEQGAGHFQDGDGITITGVRCSLDPKTAKGANVYQIEGTYHLTSHYDGTLVAEVMSKDPTKAFGRLSRGQSMRLNGANGDFTLVAPVLMGGTPRVSFYGQASSVIAPGNGQTVLFDPLALPTRGDIFGSTSFITNQVLQNVDFKTGSAAFGHNDGITITSVRGTLNTIQQGGVYQIQGTYRLASHEKAEIAVYQTQEKATNVSTQNIDNQNDVDQLVMGSGNFSLILTARDKGYAHIAMMPQGGGEDFASIYFASGDMSAVALPPPVDFPYSVQFAQGEGQLKKGDAITLTEVRGTSSRFAKGNMYLLRGKYTLATQEKATLAAMIQPDIAGDSGGADRPLQFQAVSKGSGDFCLVLPMNVNGRPYVSFRSASDVNKTLGGCYLGNAHAGEVVLDAPVKHLQIPTYASDGGLNFGLSLGDGQDPTQSLTVTATPAPPPMIYNVPIKIGSSFFEPGDNITIDSVRGTASVLQVGGVYNVQGTFALASRPAAYIAAFNTSMGLGDSDNVDPDEIMNIKQGKATYSLMLHIDYPGQPHISFYPLVAGGPFATLHFTDTSGGPLPPGAKPLTFDEALQIDFSLNTNVTHVSGPNPYSTQYSTQSSVKKK